MSMRCGMLLLQMKEATEKKALLQRLGFGKDLTPITMAYESGQIMSDADDYVVSIATLENGWISLWGQYDFNLLDDPSAKHLVHQLPDAKTVVYYAVEGTSGALIYERYENGALTNSYSEIEGRPDLEKCVGAQPKNEESDQIDEWALLKFALPPEVTFDLIADTKHEHFKFSPSR